MSINRVALSGNLTRDPEVRSLPSGSNLLTFGLAVNDRRRNPRTDEWEDYANFVDCTLFGNRAEWLSRDLHKGKKVYVEGKLRYSSWERDGQRRSKIEVIVDEIDYDRPPRQQSGYDQQGGYGQQQGGYAQQQGGYAQQSQQPAYSAPAPAPQAQPAPQPAAQPAPQQTQAQSPVVSAPPTNDVYDEDIPF